MKRKNSRKATQSKKQKIYITSDDDNKKKRTTRSQKSKTLASNLQFDKAIIKQTKLTTLPTKYPDSTINTLPSVSSSNKLTTLQTALLRSSEHLQTDKVNENFNVVLQRSPVLDKFVSNCGNTNNPNLVYKLPVFVVASPQVDSDISNGASNQNFQSNLSSGNCHSEAVDRFYSQSQNLPPHEATPNIREMSSNIRINSGLENSGVMVDENFDLKDVKIEDDNICEENELDLNIETNHSNIMINATTMIPSYQPSNMSNFHPANMITNYQPSAFKVDAFGRVVVKDEEVCEVVEDEVYEVAEDDKESERSFEGFDGLPVVQPMSGPSSNIFVSPYNSETANKDVIQKKLIPVNIQTLQRAKNTSNAEHSMALSSPYDIPAYRYVINETGSPICNVIESVGSINSVAPSVQSNVVSRIESPSSSNAINFFSPNESGSPIRYVLVRSDQLSSLASQSSLLSLPSTCGTARKTRIASRGYMSRNRQTSRGSISRNQQISHDTNIRNQQISPSITGINQFVSHGITGVNQQAALGTTGLNYQMSFNATGNNNQPASLDTIFVNPASLGLSGMNLASHHLSEINSASHNTPTTNHASYGTLNAPTSHGIQNIPTTHDTLNILTSHGTPNIPTSIVGNNQASLGTFGLISSLCTSGNIPATRGRDVIRSATSFRKAGKSQPTSHGTTIGINSAFLDTSEINSASSHNALNSPASCGSSIVIIPTSQNQMSINQPASHGTIGINPTIPGTSGINITSQYTPPINPYATSSTMPVSHGTGVLNITTSAGMTGINFVTSYGKSEINHASNDILNIPTSHDATGSNGRASLVTTGKNLQGSHIAHAISPASHVAAASRIPPLGSTNINNSPPLDTTGVNPPVSRGTIGKNQSASSTSTGTNNITPLNTSIKYRPIAIRGIPNLYTNSGSPSTSLDAVSRSTSTALCTVSKSPSTPLCTVSSNSSTSKSTNIFDGTFMFAPVYKNKNNIRNFSKEIKPLLQLVSTSMNLPSSSQNDDKSNMSNDFILKELFKLRNLVEKQEKEISALKHEKNKTVDSTEERDNGDEDDDDVVILIEEGSHCEEAPIVFKYYSRKKIEIASQLVPPHEFKGVGKNKNKEEDITMQVDGDEKAKMELDDNVLSPDLFDCTSIKKKCVLCGKYVVNLSRHLKGEKHKLDAIKRKQICFATRRRKKLVNIKGLKKCPLKGCENSPSYTRLASHLKIKHMLKPTDEKFLEILPKLSKKTCGRGKCEPIQYSSFSEEESLRFYTYLRSLKGGQKSIDNANHHRYKIRQILNDTDITNVLDLRHDTISNKFETWTENFAKRHEPPSVVTYLSILIAYLKYVQARVDKQNNEIPSLLVDVNNFKKAFRSRVIRKTNYENIPIANMNLFEKSKIGKDALTSLNSLKHYTTYDLDEKEESKIRNVIMALLIIRNSLRSGALCNMLLNKFKNCDYINNSYVVQVAEHKTKAEYGAAEIVFSNDIYNATAIYIEKIRHQVLQRSNAQCQYLFITSKGTKMSSGNFKKNLSSIWKMAGLPGDFGSSRLRHTTTTSVHANDVANVEKLAAHLCHKTSTAERHYKQLNKGYHSVKASQMIYMNNTGNVSDEVRLEENIASPNVDLPVNEIVEGKSAATNSTENSVKYIYENCISFSDGRGKATFTEEERNIIFMAYEGVINKYSKLKTEEAPKVREIRIVMDNNEDVKKMIVGKKFKKEQIKGCLRNIIIKIRGKLSNLKLAI